MIAKCPKPPKDNEKQCKSVRFNEKGNRACENGENDNDHKIYASMAQMCSDDKRKSVKYGDSSQLTNWIWTRKQRAILRRKLRISFQDH